MMNTVEAETLPGKPIDLTPTADTREFYKQASVTCTPKFHRMRDFIASTPAPKKPNRAGPIHALHAEFQAWEAASDEALENFEKQLEE